MKKTIWIVPIEPIETRYTKHWYEYLQPQIAAACGDKYTVNQIDVSFVVKDATPGAFFDFAHSMAFKSKQAEYIAWLFEEGVVQNGDIFLYTDYWNPTAHNVRYMADLLGIEVKMVGICHAGAWDPHDILGQKFKSPTWANSLEESFDKLYDHKVFATDFSRALYERTFPFSQNNEVTGFPMEYYDQILTPYWELVNPPEKENIVVFPHRISPEKNPGLFRRLAREMPEYEFIIAMEVCKTKDEYHDLLYRSKLAFSASQQETLGISMGIEALRCGCAVLVPDRLSYSEMCFLPKSFYPSVYFDYNFPEHGELLSYQQLHFDYIKESINLLMYTHDVIESKYQHDNNYTEFFTGDAFYELLNSI